MADVRQVAKWVQEVPQESPAQPGAQRSHAEPTQSPVALNWHVHWAELSHTPCPEYKHTRDGIKWAAARAGGSSQREGSCPLTPVVVAGEHMAAVLGAWGHPSGGEGMVV